MSDDRRRVVVTGYGEMRHPANAPGFRMDDKTWAHGGRAGGIPHGAVFSRRGP